jgi:glutamyl-tRNA synthetase
LGNFEGAVDDFVLCRGDGVPSYNLGVVVDDADLGVTEVVRGDDLLPSTPRQVHLFGLLGLNPPSYAHVPLVIAPSGERLAKRHGAVTMEDRLSLGESELDVLNILLSSLRIEKVASFGQLSERVKVFDSTSLPLAPWIFRD